MPAEREGSGLGPDQLVANERFVRALIRRFVVDPHLVEDLVQDTWVAALQHSAAARLLGRAWLGTVATNFAFQALRGRERRLAREAAAARALPLEADGGIVVDADLRERVLAAVAGLGEPYRAAVRLRFYEDLPPTEIAARLGLPVETVRTRIKRALKQVHAALWRAR